MSNPVETSLAVTQLQRCKFQQSAEWGQVCSGLMSPRQGKTAGFYVGTLVRNLTCPHFLYPIY